MHTKFADVSDYIAALPLASQAVAATVRAAIGAALPDAVETIRYDMPAYQLNGATVIYFAVWKKHVGLYPIYRGSAAFEAEIAPFRAKKDTVQFALGKPLPVELIAMIARAQAEKVG